MKKSYLYSIASLAIIASLASCKSKSGTSEKTGMTYNKQEFGGFQVNNKFKRGPGPGLVEIEGGVFVMSGSAINVPGQELSSYNHKRETTVSSFYMDETEVSNTNWLEYLNWIRTNFPTDHEYYYNELPDTLVWRRPLSYNEPYVDNYLRHPAYQDYPVVGVTWEQADRYCAWRTDRVNELLLRQRGYMTSFKDMNGGNQGGGAATTASARPTEPFNTDIYLNGQYDDKGKKAMKDLNPANASTGTGAGKNTATRNVRLEDGILKQPYRLPTEAEWEYAALGLIGNTQYENIGENKIYPWSGLGISSAKKKTRGMILANFKRTKGDYMGVGGSLNDKGALTVAVRSYVPNDFGLYNMAGNVNEWVADVYRSKTFEAADAFNPYRGNYYKDKKVADATTGKIEKDKYNRPVLTDAVSYKKQTWAEKQAAAAAPVSDSAVNTYADQRGYRDRANELYGETTLVNDKSRVYKGGSWDDQALWLNPATRRFLQQDESTADIGFRCAMTMLGASEIRSTGKPQFKTKASKPFRAGK